MDFSEFRQLILKTPTDELLHGWLSTATPTAFSSAEAYENFRRAVRVAFPTSTEVCVAGTANWRFSLNPKKGFSEFNDNSDIDTVIVDAEAFHNCWDEIRKKDRLTKYTRAEEENRDYRSAASAIYSGYVAPVWVLDRTMPMRYGFRSKLNSISRATAAGREVKALFFKSSDEVFDYYTRGVMLAKAKLK
ncbi:hypothetical protein [Dyella sp.]|uniref:hypothetical protein n=1 Tax=Dyella sp. TaxID=1869338 RepID=UPI003F802D45